MSMAFDGGCPHCLDNPCTCSQADIDRRARSRKAADDAERAAITALPPDQRAKIFAASIPIVIDDET